MRCFLDRKCNCKATTSTLVSFTTSSHSSCAEFRFQGAISMNIGWSVSIIRLCQPQQRTGHHHVTGDLQMSPVAHMFSINSQSNLLNPVYSSTTKLKQQKMMGYVQKTTTSAKEPIPVTKEGIKEHFLAIITTCDLVSDI